MRVVCGAPFGDGKACCRVLVELDTDDAGRLVVTPRRGVRWTMTGTILVLPECPRGHGPARLDLAKVRTVRPSTRRKREIVVNR